MRDITNSSLHAFDIILRVLDGYRILGADRDEIGGYFHAFDRARLLMTSRRLLTAPLAPISSF
jgi:hypothetical protein